MKYSSGGCDGGEMRQGLHGVGFGVVLMWTMAAGCGQVDIPYVSATTVCETATDCVLDELPCRIGTCEEDVCVYETLENTCFIDDECYVRGQSKAFNLCRVCTPDQTQEVFLSEVCEAGSSCEPTTGLCVVDESDVVVRDTQGDAPESPVDVTGDVDGVGPTDVLAASDTGGDDTGGVSSDVVSDAGASDDVEVPPVGPAIMGLWFTSYGSMFDFGETTVNVDGAGGEMNFDIVSYDNETRAMIVTGIFTEPDEVQEVFGYLGWVGPEETVKPGTDIPVKTVWVCPGGFGSGGDGGIEAAEAAGAAMDASDPAKSGCPGNDGPWIFMASVSDYAPYWGPGSCCFEDDEEGTVGCNDPVCETAVCDLSPYCCEVGWDWSCKECAMGQLEGCEAVAAVCTSCQTCGDGICDELVDEDCGSCFTDCGVCVCSDEDNEILSCDGTCAWSGGVGNDFCDDAFDCAEFNWDEGDCCADGFIEACDGTCVDPSVAGNGTCDEALNCKEADWDGDDCELVCPAGTIESCQEECFFEGFKGDGVCHWELSCVALGWDGGDCCPDSLNTDCSGACVDTYSEQDGECDPAFECAEYGWDSGDCPEVCGALQIEGCGGEGCISVWSFSDDSCDETLNCEEFQWDGGDCCQGDYYGFCYACLPSSENGWDSVGDGTCDPAYSCGETDWDGGDCQPECPPFHIACDGYGCLPEGNEGDGMCHDTLNCAEHDWDGGDCCPDGEHKTCDGSGCITEATMMELLQNGVCDDATACQSFGFDNGMCPVVCDAGNIPGCYDSCGPPSWLGDGTCQWEFDCPGFDSDWGDCCPEGSVESCDGGCVPEELFGNGVCDSENACPDAGWDAGDCLAEYCNPGDIVDCTGTACYPESWLGDEYCDANMLCAENDWDAGDCYTCGDDACLPGENVVCPGDCGLCVNNEKLQTLLKTGPVLVAEATETLTDVVVEPDGDHWIAWTNGSGLNVRAVTVSDDGATNGTNYWDISDDLAVIMQPSLSSDGEGNVAVAYRNGQGPGAFVQRFAGGAFQKPLDAIPNMPPIIHSPALAHASSNGELFVAWAGAVGLGGGLRVGLSRLGESLEPLGGSFDLLGEEWMTPVSAPSIAALPGGSALVAWATGGGANTPADLLLQEVQLDGDHSDPVNLTENFEPAVFGTPVVATSLAGTANIVFRTESPAALWYLRFDTGAGAVSVGPQLLVPEEPLGSSTGPVEAQGGLVPRYDIATNGDGWSLIAVGMVGTPSRLYRVAPVTPIFDDFMSLGGAPGIPRVGAATCFDDVVVAGPEFVDNVLGVYSTYYRADDDANGVADLCCNP